MNCSVYIFGELSSGYTQYPEDSSSNVLKLLYPKCKAETQIAIHRDASIMYYCYIRKLIDNKYIGLCIAVNGYYIKRVEELFSLFENTIEKIAQQGIFIHFSKDGSLTTSVTNLRNEEEEIDTLSENLRRGFEALGSTKNKLPQEDYSVAKNTFKEFNVLDDTQDIVRASYTYGYTFIYKDKDYNTVRINSYKSILSRLNEENQNLKKENTKLQESNQKILRQKKQFKNVIFLILLVFACGVGIFLLYDNLINTQGELNKANSTINKKNSKINRLSSSIDSLQLEYDRERNMRVAVEEELSNICTNNPIIVTNCIVSSSSFSFDFYANKEDEISVTLKAINERTSEIISNRHAISFDKGSGYKTLSFSHMLSESDYYNVVLVYDDRIIAGTRW